MTASITLYDRVQAAAEAVRARASLVPEIGIILGTGLGGLASQIAVEAEVPYGEIPGFPLSTVETHAGKLLLGRLGGRPVVAMQGRFHRYEGYDLQQVTFPVRVLHALGARTLLVSNACGGMNPLWGPGDLVLLERSHQPAGRQPARRTQRRAARTAVSRHVGALRSRAPGARAHHRPRAPHRAARRRVRGGAGAEPRDPRGVPDAARHRGRRRRDVDRAGGDRRRSRGHAHRSGSRSSPTSVSRTRSSRRTWRRSSRPRAARSRR